MRLAFGAVLALASSLLAAQLPLVENGRSQYSICLAPGGSPSQSRGAEELQRFLEEMSGARLPIIAKCGTGPAIVLQSTEEFGPEGFSLRTDGRNLVIAGGRQRGTMYGVYTLLERLGCRWFARDLSRIPKKRTIEAPPLNEVQKPAFEMRWPGITEAVDKEWAARNKLNGGGLPLDASTGGRVECAPCGHSFYWLIPPAVHFKDHPEYFSLVDGKRRSSGAQLCLTNPDMIRTGAERILKWIEEHPEVDMVGVCQEDHRGWCECENCQRAEQEEGGAHSGPIVRFVNALAEQVGRKYPKARILTYAYQYSEQPPAKTRPHPNVRIQLAPISACVGHPAERCPFNKELLMDNLKGWGRLTNQIYMYGYATNFAHFLYPFPDFYRLAEDVPMLKRNGVAGIYYESSHQGLGGNDADLRAWVMAKLFWNPSENVDRLVNEFMETAYGRGAPPMRAVFDLIHREVRLPPDGKGKHLWIDQAPWLPPDVVGQASKLYGDALRAAEGDAERKRIRKASLWVEYCELFEMRRFEVRGGLYRPGNVEQIKSRYERWWQQKTALEVGYLNNDRLEDNKAFVRRLKSFEVMTLENASLRADLVPELSSRIVRLIDKRTGKDLTRRPSPAGVNYPDGSGIYVAIHPEPGGDGFEATWEVESKTASAVALRGILKNGLAIHRKIELVGGEAVLRTQNRLENRSDAPRNGQILSRFDTAPESLDDVTSAVKPGEVVMRDQRRGIAITGKFSTPDPEQATVTKDTRHGLRATLQLRTRSKLLAPGESVRLDVEYTVQPTAALAEDGRSDYSIVVEADASPSQKRGAAELQRFLFEMSGARLPVVGQRGTGPAIVLKTAEEYGPEGFHLKTSGRDVGIAGGRLRGTMYGVYEFLERLGCRWYARDLTVVPNAKTIQLEALDVTGKPAFEYREIYSYEAQDKDWAARNRTNGNFTGLDESTGGKVVYYPWGHSFYDIIPPEKYFKTHPEYFSLVSGERRYERGQLCLSNQEMTREAAKNVLRMIAEHPEATIISVSQNDHEGWCECGNCRRIEKEEGDVHSGPIIRFVNAVAEEVDKKHPGKLIDTFAYSWSERAPRLVRPRGNVRVRLAPIGNCQGHPYEQCPHNAYVMNNLRAWSRLTDKLYVWHYTTNFWQYLGPYPNFDEIRADIPMYQRHGVVGMFLQGPGSTGYGGELLELRNYLEAKLLWNPAADSQAIIGEFLNAYYGPAAGKVREYIELMQREVRPAPHGLGKAIWVYRSPFWSPGFLPAAKRLFDEMEQVVRNSPDRKVIEPRIRKSRLSLDWMELSESRRFYLDGDVYGPRDPEGFWSRFRVFLEDLKSFGITMVHEWCQVDETEREYAQYVKRHQAVTIENDWLKVVVVPELNGRVIRLVNKRTGREALRYPDPDERYSNVESQGGLVLLAHQEYYGRERFDPLWRVESQTRDAVVLKGTCVNGLVFQRRLELAGDAPALRTFSTLTNRYNLPVTAVLQSRAEVNPGDHEHPTVDLEFSNVEGRTVRRPLLPQTGQYFGIEAYLAGNRPAGEWRAVNRGAGMTLKSRFSLDQVPRCRLWWRGRGENKVDLSLWSEKKDLRAGESLRLDAEYVVE